VNAAIYALNMVQEGMKGELEKDGIMNDDDVMALAKDVRSEIESV
jgi:hypothetical protein